MIRRTAMLNFYRRLPIADFRILNCLLALLLLTACGHRETRVEIGNREQILHLANGTEPEDLDPQVITGVQEYNIIQALIEGLVSEDPVDLHPVPGVAESWTVSPDGLVYTFYIRTNALWSNGDPVTANDFVMTYRRALSPQLANQYVDMLFCVTNAEAYHRGALTNFNEVGFRAIDRRTFQFTLAHPVPYFLSLLNHHSWFPVHVPTIREYGDEFQRGNRWTRPGHFVGNGPFELVEWKVNRIITVRKNPRYWDAQRVRLKEIRFYPIESLDVEERAFRAGQVHKTEKLPLTKVDYYQQHHPELLLEAPYLGTYFYMINVRKAPFNDKRVRRALALAIDRESITRRITRAGEIPAYTFTPPNTAGYSSRAKIHGDIAEAKRLLAEAGYPEGRGFPKFEILYNTLESHKTIAEAIQQMWKETLHIDVGLRNEEWKVYLNSKTVGDYDVARYGWIADYVDPSAFLEMWITGGGNNESGWSNPEYDRLISEAARTGDVTKRYQLMQDAEAILLDELPIIPIYYYVSIYLMQPSVKNWNPTILDHHPYKYVYLEP